MNAIISLYAMRGGFISACMDNKRFILEIFSFLLRVQLLRLHPICLLYWGIARTQEKKSFGGFNGRKKNLFAKISYEFEPYHNFVRYGLFPSLIDYVFLKVT